ncbi:Cof-type HAD-IIB family hydrolase [Streptococcus phocae subsp. salmonis]|uniref:Cof-type HAD-IIB family hydrolase n=1 Tax=Streptococcus phocae TaxID=119224 RepID=UPI000531D560|nr:Cof-type HAD-IIB family hydrolase [Streptococcus phocae]KGR72288.1 haloacid dehalogenase [Streptococcus phocae subsp. salmonis]
MTRVKLLALDLDGTLYSDDKVISFKNKEALIAARKQGVAIVITTGRPLRAIGDLLEELDLCHPDHYCITFNGGLVHQTTGEVLAKHALTFQEVQEIHCALDGVGLPTDILSDGCVYSLSSRDGRSSQYPLANPLLTFVNIESIDDLPRDIVYNKIVTVTSPDFLDQQLAQLPSALFASFEAFKSRDIIFEVMPKGVHKAAGLALLCQHLGIDARQVMAIGDEANDVSMLTWAGRGVAMANAVASAKAAADVVTQATNNQSGVAEAIQHYIVNEEN